MLTNIVNFENVSGIDIIIHGNIIGSTLFAQGFIHLAAGSYSYTDILARATNLSFNVNTTWSATGIPYGIGNDVLFMLYPNGEIKINTGTITLDSEQWFALTFITNKAD